MSVFLRGWRVAVISPTRDRPRELTTLGEDLLKQIGYKVLFLRRFRRFVLRGAEGKL